MRGLRLHYFRFPIATLTSINAVVPQDRLLPAARELAGRIIRHSPPAVAATITAATHGVNLGIAEGLQAESEQSAVVMSTAELREVWHGGGDTAMTPGPARHRRVRRG